MGFLLLTILAVITEIFILYLADGIIAGRIFPEKLSNGDENEILITLNNRYKFNIECLIIDEIPFQLQKRDFKIVQKLSSDSEITLKYILRPVKRGSYTFGKLNVYANGILGLGSRKFIFCEGSELPVYPSFLKIKHYEMKAISNRLINPGIKEVRKLGHTMEFEHIREYRNGDDYRSINWKATGRKGDMMVNQFIDERSQNIYCIIDMGRNMKMPFNGMTLLDYSINSTLAISSIVQKKYDKAGLVTFSDELGTFIPASNSISQRAKITESLYRLETNYAETSFEILYSFIRRKIPQRSLLMIFTNFETINAMRRNIDYIKLIAKFHLPLIVFFENTEVSKMLNDIPQKDFDIYKKITAEQFMIEKQEIINELRMNGIMSLLCKPEDLTLKTINKYLEIKSRRLV